MACGQCCMPQEQLEGVRAGEQPDHATIGVWRGGICCDRKASYEGAGEPALLTAGNMKKAESVILTPLPEDKSAEPACSTLEIC